MTMTRQFPMILVGKNSELIGLICPFCKKYFLFGDQVFILSRKGIYAHRRCVKGGKDDG